MGYVTGGGSTGSGGAPSGAASGELAGTYPGPTIADAVIDDANIVAGGLTNAALATAAAIANTKLATNPLARANHTGTQTMSTISDAGTLATKSAIASADITDGTIVTGDLSATAGITSGQLAGSIAPSKITGTAVTAADTGTVTSAMIVDATIVGGDLSPSIVLPSAATATSQTVGDNSTKLASTAYVDRYRPDYYYNGSSVNIAETIPRQGGPSWVTTIQLGTTGVMTSYAVFLKAGMVITNLTFRTGGTAGATMTHWWLALYDTQATPALIAQTADQTSAAIGNASTVTVALGSPAPYTVTTTGIHYVSIMVAATTIPTLTGVAGQAAMNGAIVSGQKILAQTSGSSLTATAPSTIASASTVAGVGYGATS